MILHDEHSLQGIGKDPSAYQIFINDIVIYLSTLLAVVMKKRILGLSKYLLFLGLGIFLLWLTLRKSNWEEIKNDILTANFIFLIPATIMLLMSHLSRAVRWKILMEPLGYKPTLLNTFFAVMIGYWANLAVPRLGEVLKCTILGRYEKVPADKLVGTIVAERAFDVVSLVVLFAHHIGIQYDLIGHICIGQIYPKFFRNKAEQCLVHENFYHPRQSLLAFFLMIFSIRKAYAFSFIQKTKTFLKGYAGT